MKTFHIALCATLLFASCVSIPEKRAKTIKFAVTAPESYHAQPDLTLNVAKGLLELFDDEQLHALIDLALSNNPDLMATAAKMAESGFKLQKANSGRLPSLTSSGSAFRSGSSTRHASDSFSASLDAKWEVDIWSKLRNLKGAAQADLQLAEASFEASRQSLVAQVIQGWFKLIARGQILDLAEKEQSSFGVTLRLVERRYKRGTATMTELELARTDAASANANHILSQNSLSQAARELQVLLGEYPNAELYSTRAWPKLTHGVPSGLPSDLLLSRPDIRAAYQGIRAADARARAAYADLFPSFTLTASGGRSTNTLSSLGRSTLDTWSLAGQVAAPIFEGGARTAEVGAAEQRAERAYQNYRTTVLNAFKEVEDALNSESYLADEESQRLIALKAARKAEAKSLRDYEFGLINLLDLLNAQRRVFNIETQAINLRQARLSNRVALTLALGKGI